MHHSISQMKHQLDAILCRFNFCRVTLHVSGASAHHQEYLKLVQRPLVHVLSLQVSHHISMLYCSGSMCVGVTVWFGWGGMVSLCRLKLLNTWNKSTISRMLLKMDALTFETCWAVNSEIIKQVTSSWSIFIQLDNYLFVTKFFGPLSVRRLKAITHPTASVILLTENHQTVFTPGTPTSFSTPSLKINGCFPHWPNLFLLWWGL